MEYDKTEIAENLQKVQNEIKTAEKTAGRPVGSVKLLAVSKFHSVQAILAAREVGQMFFGENRVQEACSKFNEIRKTGYTTELHIIGTLQRNKVRDAVKIAQCIESVDRIELLTEIEKKCVQFNKTLEILFEYHTGESSKSGFASYNSLRDAVHFCAIGKTPHIIPKGFMTMAPFTDDEHIIRSSFSVMRETAEKIKQEFPELQLNTLSMGMSGDFRIAIEEGSTIVRIGTAIFGARNSV